MSSQVYISNVFPDGNKGGAAITSATIQAVERAVPDAEVTLIVTQVDPGESLDRTHRFTRASHPNVAVTMPLVSPGRGPLAGLRMVVRSLLLLIGNPKRSPNSTVRAIANSKLVVSKGGYVFVERETIRQVLRVWLTAFPLVVAYRAGVRSAAIGATVGPFKTWHSRALNRWILRRVDLIVPRDDYSYQEAVSIGVPKERILKLPDVVFAHSRPKVSARDEVLKRLGLHGQRYAAITVLKGPQDDKFFPVLKQVLQSLLNDGSVDRVAVVVQSTQDLTTTRMFYGRLNDERAVLIDDDLSPEDLMSVYSGARFIIARRMHSAIFSLVTGTPTFAVVFYGKKVQGVMRSLGLEHYLVDYPDVDPSALAQRIHAALDDEAWVRQQNLAAVSEAARKLEALPLALARLVDGAQPSSFHADETASSSMQVQEL